MDLKGLSEPLKPEDIEVYPANVIKTKNGAMAMPLCYKTARVDVKRLDEVCGAGYWKNKYFYDNKGLLCCSIGIYNKEIKEWVWKEDVGTESSYEKEKGSYSDAMKRAGFKWGIGAELYSEDFKGIMINLDGSEYKLEGNKVKINSWIKFHVKSLNPLVIVDDNGKERYTKKTKYTRPEPPKKLSPEEQKKHEEKLKKEQDEMEKKQTSKALRTFLNHKAVCLGTYEAEIIKAKPEVLDLVTVSDKTRRNPIIQEWMHDKVLTKLTDKEEVDSLNIAKEDFAIMLKLFKQYFK